MARRRRCRPWRRRRARRHTPGTPLALPIPRDVYSSYSVSPLPDACSWPDSHYAYLARLSIHLLILSGWRDAGARIRLLTTPRSDAIEHARAACRLFRHLPSYARPARNGGGSGLRRRWSRGERRSKTLQRQRVVRRSPGFHSDGAAVAHLLERTRNGRIVDL